MKQKNLPIEYPLFTLYSHHANIFAILKNNEYDIPFLLNHYMQLAYNKSIDRMDFSIGLDILAFIKNYPLVYVESINRKRIKYKWSSVIEYVKRCLEDDYYVYCLVDTYYIPCYKQWYLKKHIAHNILIYGFDNKKNFFVADNFVNGKYSFDKVKFEEFEKGYNGQIEYDWFEGIVMIKINESPYKAIGYNIPMIKNGITNYIKSKNYNWITAYEYGNRNDQIYVYGLNIYFQIQNYIDKLNGWCDIRLFYTLYEHKRYLVFLCKELYYKNKVCNASQHYVKLKYLENQTKILYFLVLKYNASNCDKILKKLKEKLKIIQKIEREILHDWKEDLVENIEDHDIDKNIIESSNIAIEYSEGWIETFDGEKFYTVTRQKDAYFKYQFHGSKIELYAICDKLGGIVRIEIDGKIMERINTYSDVEESRIIYKCDTIKFGYHLLKVIFDENKHEIKIKNIKIYNKHTKEKILNEVQVLNHDTYTKGNWNKKYGKEGYNIIGYSKKLPSYITYANYNFQNSTVVLLMKKCEDIRALSKTKDNKQRIIAYELSDKEFSINLIISGEKLRHIAFYCVDFDRLNRKFEIICIDFDNKNILYREKIEEFSDGIYLNFKMRGRIKIIFKNIGNADAVVSGVFFQ